MMITIMWPEYLRLNVTETHASRSGILHIFHVQYNCVVAFVRYCERFALATSNLQILGYRYSVLTNSEWDELHRHSEPAVYTLLSGGDLLLACATLCCVFSFTRTPVEHGAVVNNQPRLLKRSYFTSSCLSFCFVFEFGHCCDRDSVNRS